MTSELGVRMLNILEKRGYRGADREIFFHNIRGMRYTELEKEILTLESEGYISINWIGPSNFTALITPRSIEFTRAYQEGVSQENDQNIGNLNNAKHEENEIGEDFERYQNINDNKDLENVDEFPDEPIGDIDEQNIMEQEISYEEPNSSNGDIQSEKIIENEDLETEEKIAEEQISGNIAGEGTNDGDISENPIDYTLQTKTEYGSLGTNEIIEPENRSVENVIFSGSDNGNPIVSQGIVDNGHEATFSTGGEEADDVSFKPDATDEDILSPEFFREIEALLNYEQDPDQETDEESVTDSSDTLCCWESERECPILKGNKIGIKVKLSTEHCIVCQLLEIKRLLNNQMLRPTQ
jgi:hypothetical protein